MRDRWLKSVLHRSAFRPDPLQSPLFSSCPFPLPENTAGSRLSRFSTHECIQLNTYLVPPSRGPLDAKTSLRKEHSSRIWSSALYCFWKRKILMWVKFLSFLYIPLVVVSMRINLWKLSLCRICLATTSICPRRKLSYDHERKSAPMKLTKSSRLDHKWDCHFIRLLQLAGTSIPTPSSARNDYTIDTVFYRICSVWWYDTRVGAS